MKKKLILLILFFLCTYQSLFSQTIQYKVIQDTEYLQKRIKYPLPKDSILEWKYNDFFDVDYDSFNNQKEIYNPYIKARYNDKNIYMYTYNSDLEIIDSEKIIKNENFNLIPCYYLDLIKTKNKKIIFTKQPNWNDFKNQYRTFEGETFYDSFYPEEIVISNFFVYFTMHNYYIVENISFNKEIYKIKLLRNAITISGLDYIFEYEQPYPEIYMKYKDENEISLFLKFDGDYVDIWINSKDEYMGKYFVAPKKTTQKEINNLVSTGNYNSTNIYWPRHADGSSDFDNEIKPPLVQLVDNQNTQNSTEVSAGATTTKTVSTSTNVAVKKTMTTNCNLKLRSGEATSTQVLTVMSAGTKVKIFELGKAETIDGFTSNWVKVEVQSGAKDRDGKSIKAGTVGWCYGGYLE